MKKNVKQSKTCKKYNYNILFYLNRLLLLLIKQNGRISKHNLPEIYKMLLE